MVGWKALVEEKVEGEGCVSQDAVSMALIGFTDPLLMT